MSLLGDRRDRAKQDGEPDAGRQRHPGAGAGPGDAGCKERQCSAQRNPDHGDDQERDCQPLPDAEQHVRVPWSFAKEHPVVDEPGRHERHPQDGDPGHGGQQ